MSDTNAVNKALGTQDIIWNLADIYSGVDDHNLHADMDWCADEAKKIRSEYYGKVVDWRGYGLLHTQRAAGQQRDCSHWEDELSR